MRFRGTLLLLITVLLLSSVYFFYLRPRSDERTTAAEFGKRFFQADPAEIVSIRIENLEGVVELAHGPQGWLIVQPRRYRPDEGMIKKLLETIGTGKLTKVVGGTADLKEFGFDRPVLSVNMVVGTRKEALIIGQKNPTDTAYYAYSEALGKIFLVNSELPEELYLRLYDLREKRLYPAVSPETLGRIVITTKGEKLELEFSDDAWRLRVPLDARGGGAEVRAFVTALAEKKAAAFFPWEQKLQSMPQKARVQLYDRFGQQQADSEIIYLGTGADEGVVVHEPGAVEAARVSRDFWELVHTPPVDLLERNLFPADPALISRISVVSGNERIVLERQGSHWLKNGARVSEQKAGAVIELLRNWKGAKLVTESVPTSKAWAIIEVADPTGVSTLLVSDRDLSQQMSRALPTLASDHATARIAYWLGTASALGRSVLVASPDLERFLTQVRELK